MGPAQPQEDLTEEEDPDEGAGGPPKSARHDSSLLSLHSNIQAAAGLHMELMRFVIDAEIPFKKLDNPQRASRGHISRLAF